MTYIEIDRDDQQEIAETLIAPELLDAFETGDVEYVLSVAVELRDAAQAVIAGRVSPEFLDRLCAAWPSANERGYGVAMHQAPTRWTHHRVPVEPRPAVVFSLRRCAQA